MTTNFHFLAKEFTIFYERAVKAEQLVITDPRTSLIYSRMALEEAVNWMYTNDRELVMPYESSLNSLLTQLKFQSIFNHIIYSDLHLIRKVGNLAAHNRSVNDIDSHKAIESLFRFAKWFCKSYSQDEWQDPGIFDFNVLPKKGASALTKRQINELQESLDNQLRSHKEELKEKEAERQKLVEENELYKKRIENLQAQFEYNKEAANVIDDTHRPISEQETRKYLIDVNLREAGWDLAGANDKEYQVQYMPKSTNKSETGYVDYVLWDDDGRPLALVEAKRSIESATKGENQAQLYADSLEKMFGRRPVMYYSNGYETFLWDDKFYKQSRKVHGFYTKAELQTLMFRRTHRKDIRTAPIDPEIAGRHYQMRSIKSIAEHFAGTDARTGKLIGTNRGALLVLATGTGKTRTAISFSKLMLECNWAKRILFLADRISLVEQAKRNFVKFLPQHASVNLLEEKDNPDARIAFSTYKTMMGLIDRNRDDQGRFYGVGHFDLIIIDEAHRSIYKKYQAIFDYFDALLVGLTATPKDDVDKNTYDIFGLENNVPTYAYELEEAVRDGYLVPYNNVETKIKFLEEGIHYDELSDEEKEQYEETFIDEEEFPEFISGDKLNTWLFNDDTIDKVLAFLMEKGIKVEGGDKLGKTIIFAKNHNHALRIVERFDAQYPAYKGQYAQVIDNQVNYAQDLIDKFSAKDKMPQIAVSVDMLDTGIDIPEVVNLVFFKKVRSKTKFWQMIGRGTRLCPELFGPGLDKENFLIFDFCGNFEFFRVHPKGIEAKPPTGLTEKIFNTKLDLIKELQHLDYQEEKYVNYRNKLITDLVGDINALNRGNFAVKQHLHYVEKYSDKKQWDKLCCSSR